MWCLNPGPPEKRSSIEHLIALDNTIPPWLAAMVALTKASDVVLFAAEERLHTWERAGWYKLYQMALLIGQVKLAANALKSYQAISATLLGPDHPHVRMAVRLCAHAVQSVFFFFLLFFFLFSLGPFRILSATGWSVPSPARRFLCIARL